ncbi:MAG: tetraacyldisaccharide 4'-kinase [Gammaproteobacteria bacterium]|nr:tetraacyldisaccharide 4'-kinase [Gammaproteobacteria bacterium]
MSKFMEKYWYRKPERVPVWARILSFFFQTKAVIRRILYIVFFFRVYKAKVPVIVVGNINVDGVGKTPVIAWLVQELKRRGYSPGIVGREYGGQAEHWPQQVRPDSDPLMVGDEAVLLARHCQCPMGVGPERVAAIKQLTKYYNVDVIISDNGILHYAMGRDMEIAVIDGERRFGNGYCLPAGPLLEPVGRIDNVDFRINNGGDVQAREYAMQISQQELVNLKDPNKTMRISELNGKRAHAIAGIGKPKRFFEQLVEQGIKVEEHPFEDHHPYQAGELDFGDKDIVLMTEKDAVKCERFAQDNYWYVRMKADIDSDLGRKILESLEKTSQPQGKIDGQQVARHPGMPAV